MLMPCACPSRAESLKHHCGPPLEPLVQGQQRQRHMRRMPPYLYIRGSPGRSTPQGLRGVLASPDSCIYFNKLLADCGAAARGHTDTTRRRTTRAHSAWHACHLTTAHSAIPSVGNAGRCPLDRRRRAPGCWQNRPVITHCYTTASTSLLTSPTTERSTRIH